MDRTNISDKGYTFNGQDYTYQNKVNSQGQNYQVAVPNVISASTLQTPQATINPVQPQYNTATPQDSANAQAYLIGDQQKAQMQADQLRESKNTMASDIGQLALQVGNKSNDINQAYNQVGVDGQSVNDKLTAKNKLAAESRSIELQQLANTQRERDNAQGRLMTGSGLDMNIANVNRKSTVRQLELAAQSAIANADYESAKAYQDKIIDAKYEAITAKKEAAIVNLDNIKENLTAQETKLAAATLARLNKEIKDEEKKKADEKQVSDLIINASPVASPDVMARAKAIQAKGGSATDVAMALGQYGGDFYKTLLLKEQIETQKSNRLTDAAQRAKLYQDVAESKSKMGGVASPTFLDPKVIDNPTFKLAQSLTPVKTAIQAYKDAITKYGAYELADAEGRGAINSTYGNALAAWKTMAGLGALSGADFTLAENAIPEPAIFSRNATSISKLDNSLANANSQIGTYVKTLKTAYPNSVGGIDATINVKETPKVPTINKFGTALGKPSTPIMGTTYVNKVADDGSIDFNIPTK